MPFVFRGLHHLEGGLVFFGCLLVLPSLLVERPEIGVAERYAEVAARIRVQRHRLAVTDPSGVYLPVVLEDSSEVGIVDGLSQRAAQLPLAFQSHAQHAVRTLVVAQCHIDVAQSVERHHTVFPCGEGSVGAIFAQFPRTVMVLLCHIEHAHASIVGADIVQRLHPFQRVAYRLGLPQSLAVSVQGLLEAALVAQRAAPFSQSHNAPESVAFPFQSLLQPGERVDAVGGTHDAVGCTPVGRGENRTLLAARDKQETDQCKR